MIQSDDDGHRACLGNPGCNLEEQEEFRQQVQVTGLVDMFDYQDRAQLMPESERFTCLFTDKGRKQNLIEADA